MGGFYESPDYTIQRHVVDPSVAGAAGSTMRKYLLYAAAKLKAIHWAVLTAGTNASAGCDIYVGTASVGAITFGTATAGEILHSGLLNVDVPDNAIVELRGKANSATAVGSVNVEWEMLLGAQES